jgi:ribosome recycling factor
MSGQSEILTFNYPNMVVRVHLPDLTDEEQKNRMKMIYKATEELLKEKIGGKRVTHRS